MATELRKLGGQMWMKDQDWIAIQPLRQWQRRQHPHL